MQYYIKWSEEMNYEKRQELLRVEWSGTSELACAPIPAQYWVRGVHEKTEMATRPCTSNEKQQTTWNWLTGDYTCRPAAKRWDGPREESYSEETYDKEEEQRSAPPAAAPPIPAPPASVRSETNVKRYHINLSWIFVFYIRLSTRL